MESDRRTAVIAGILFIVATAASLLATAVEGSVLTGASYLGEISHGVTRVSAGGLLELIAAGTSAGIAISLYPVLRKRNATLALGAVVFRAVEAVMYALAAVSMLSLFNVAQQFAEATSGDRAGVQAIGNSLIAFRQEAILAGVFAFAFGALMYYVVFYSSRLIPQWQSLWGIAGVLLMIVACLAAIFSRNPVTSYTALILPIAVQEMVMAVWLIGRGFRSVAVEPAALPRVSVA